MLRVMECFAGIGAASKALENLGIEHKIVDAVEIDKYAVKSFNAIHNTNFEPQDITKWDKDIECDFIMHGSPCQDFSVAGLQAGGDKDSGTRSSLMYETLRIVEKLKPKYVVWENVKNLLSKKHRHNFDAYLEAMGKFGYKNYYQVLDAQNYGVPQHRERIFTVSILGDGGFKFPEPIPLRKRLKDVLEKEVDQKYYLDSKYEEFIKVNENYGMMDGGVIGKMHDSSRRAYSPEYVSPTLPTCAGGNIQPKVIEGPTPLQRKVCDKALDKGLVKPNDAIEYTYSNARLKEMDEGYVKKQNRANNQIMSTLKTNPQQIGVCVDEPYRIRKLTPRECYRLMGFDDDSFERAEKVNSDTQLYKQAGNSIVVDVLMAIFKELFSGQINS